MKSPSRALAVLLEASPRWSAVRIWNEWRRENPQAEADFQYASIPSELSLAAADLRHATFTGASLCNVNLRCARLTNANFYKADLRGADLSAADLTNADLRAADLRNVDLRGATLDGVQFGTVPLETGALVQRAFYRSRPFDTCDLSGAELRSSKLQGVNLSYLRMSGIILSCANLTESVLAATDLRGADLSCAILTGADLVDADLSHADLSGARLHRARLIGARLDGARLNGTSFAGAQLGWTALSDTRFETAAGIDAIQHFGPSTIDVDSVMRGFDAAGLRIQGASFERVDVAALTTFYRGVGIPEPILEMARSRASSTRHASCFISYSSADIEFVMRLYRDLQNAGVRCWYAPDNMKAGDDITVRLKQSIQEQAKMIVVLSEPAQRSRWVELEVTTALAEERRDRSKNVLLPIRIDDSVDASQTEWVRALRDKRHFADFRGWEKPDRYARAWREFLDALIASETP